MIKLKDILLEGEYIGDKWYPKHTREALRYVLSQDDVPIYPKIMSKVIGKLPITAFHVTGVSHLDGVKHMLGTKKSMSTFNRASASNLLGKGHLRSSQARKLNKRLAPLKALSTKEETDPRAPPKVEVKLERGSLFINILNEKAIMTGPAEISYHGSLEI